MRSWGLGFEGGFEFLILFLLETGVKGSDSSSVPSKMEVEIRVLQDILVVLMVRNPRSWIARWGRATSWAHDCSLG